MNLIERAKSILLQPKEAWVAIESESTDAATLFTRYYMILAAIPVVCGFIGLSLIGFGGFGVTVRVPLVSGLVNMVVSYVLSLVGVFVLALIIDALAPAFGGQKNQIQALKVAVYASTAAMLGGVFSLLPALAMLGLLAALYSIYLLYTGLPVLMKSAPEKSVAYTVVVIIAAIVMGVVIGAVSSVFMPGGGSLFGGAAAPAVTLNTPKGSVSIDTAGLEAAGKKMEEAARQLEQAQKGQDPAAIAAATGKAAAAAAGALGGGQAIAAQSLKAALPESLAGLPRTGFDVQDGAALGLPTSQASAQYGSDSKQVRLEITDIGGLGQMAVMAMGMAQGEKEDQTSAEKTWQEGGRTLHQRYEKDGSHAEFKAILKNGLVVSVEGDHMGVKDLRGILGQVDLNGLEGLQRKGKS
ncbi:MULTISPECIES: Yip1 family protein [unclassified Acidovorax]|uniref:Yip1 family protein n=1 Tax=unclassified Acidovorax TaxID=2684926 RepID=UPI001C455D43|nr:MULTISPECIES: Yip1 family protein [unclassified Acidovorax]MBV7428122.1 YIP1 family protein [Acidovorax sp. sif0732]MBV7449379.1 YIP1 family protein [Acidovorax sp. sif0715]